MGKHVSNSWVWVSRVASQVYCRFSFIINFDTHTIEQHPYYIVGNKANYSIGYQFYQHLMQNDNSFDQKQSIIVLEVFLV